MSGYADEGMVAAEILPPNTAFLPKPFSAASLASRVRDLLDTPTA
jgi:hypothetical protein